MCPRLILLPSEQPNEAAPAHDEVISLTAFPVTDGSERVDLVARVRVEPETDEKDVQDEILNRIHALMPFSEGRIICCDQDRPLWDDDGWLEDPEPGRSWPAEVDLRVPGRTPVYRLDRAGVAGLGLEGDLLLGWRAGDAIASELR